MELSLAVNRSAVALSEIRYCCSFLRRLNYSIFMPVARQRSSATGALSVFFRGSGLTFAVFDRTGTITAENLVVEGVGWCRVHTFPSLWSYFKFSVQPGATWKRLVNVKETSRETTLCLVGRTPACTLDDGTIVGDPMEKTTLEALESEKCQSLWHCVTGSTSAPHRTSLHTPPPLPIRLPA